jgi:4a-hydroxytetrahydrobiopterin dehydratase
MSKLSNQKCIPCEGGEVTLLSRTEAEKLLTEVSGWDISKNGKVISKEILFKNFDKAMDFVNMVADRAEQEGHHPDIHIWYNKVLLELSTHSIKGLSANDFILAAKIDAISL